jgi:SAM-dependent methyltransferase
MIAESPRLYGRLPLIQGTGEQLPFRDGAFDVVIGFDVLEHMPAPDRFLSEARRVLGSSGVLLIQTPNKWLNMPFEMLRYRSLTAWRVDHCSLQSPPQLVGRMARHGFDAEFFPIPVVSEWFRRKVRAVMGLPGLWALRLLQPDRWPQSLRPNLYVRARKT